MIAVALIIAATINVACSNDNCVGNSTGIPLAAFYHENTSVTLNGITVYGIGAPNDSAIIRESNASQVYMPFRIGTGNCQYVLDYNIDGTANDTLTFEYDAIPYFESLECGAMYNFKINNYSHTPNAIDSVIINDPMITNADVVSIKIYMR